MYKFLATFGDKKAVIEAKELYKAKAEALQVLKVPLSKIWQLDVRLIKDDEVTIDSNDL